MFQPDPQPDSPLDPELTRSAVAAALGSAFRARLGVPPDLERLVRQHGRALRESGMRIEKAVIHIKELVRSETGGDEAVFIPSVVGWAIAGYFAGTDPAPRRARE